MGVFVCRTLFHMLKWFPTMYNKQMCNIRKRFNIISLHRFILYEFMAAQNKQD